MMASAQYDPEADALYVRLSEGSAERQTYMGDFRILDYSKDGRVLGVEFLCAREGIDLQDIPFATRIERLIGESGLQFKIFA